MTGVAGPAPHLELRPYRLPLNRPWTSARGVVPARRGWLVTATAGGQSGFGDCAPLPTAGTETLLSARRRLRQGVGVGPVAAADRSAPTPAAGYALDCAGADLESRLAGLTLRRHLSRDARDRVPVNAVLGALIDATPADLAQAVHQGFRVIKLKVGLAAPGRELEHLRTIAARLPPGVGLRLDANGAWDPETAEAILRALGAFPVESLEEPLDRPDWPALARLQDRTPFPLALDESVADAVVGLDPARYPLRRIVLKPTAVGGLRRTLDTARRFQAAGVEVVITSLVESAAGLWPTAQLAAALGSTTPQGLATAAWLGADLGPPPPIRDGWLHLPSTPGSGFEPYPPDAQAGL